MSAACRPHPQAQLGREARADWVEVLVRETMARKVTAVAITDHHDGCGDLVQAAAKRLDTAIRVYAALRPPTRTTLSASPLLLGAIVPSLRRAAMMFNPDTLCGGTNFHGSFPSVDLLN
jgi:hypothetical protein